MKTFFPYLILAGLFFAACSTPARQEEQTESAGTEELPSLSQEIKIKATNTTIWNILTDTAYAKVLGNEFDEGAFMESDWQLGSEVHFVYEPDKIVATGTISHLIQEEFLQVDYNLSGYEYTEQYRLTPKGNETVLDIYAGPYGDDYEDQKVVWGNWLQKVKELSEAEFVKSIIGTWRNNAWFTKAHYLIV